MANSISSRGQPGPVDRGWWSTNPPELDIVIPVFNESPTIGRALDSLGRWVHTSFRVLICHDSDRDDTLAALASYPAPPGRLALVKNRREGVLGAVVSGLEATSAPAVLIMPAHDDYNAHRIDNMMDLLRAGCDVVCASRFMPGARVDGLPWRKSVLARASSFLLHRWGGLPTHDSSNGFRLFSRRVIEKIPIESKRGHAYSLELLVKCHRLGWRIAEVPAEWSRRWPRKSRFRIIAWLPTYLRWFAFTFSTTYLGRTGVEGSTARPNR